MQPRSARQQCSDRRKGDQQTCEGQKDQHTGNRAEDGVLNSAFVRPDSPHHKIFTQTGGVIKPKSNTSTMKTPNQIGLMRCATRIGKFIYTVASVLDMTFVKMPAKS